MLSDIRSSIGGTLDYGIRPICIPDPVKKREEEKNIERARKESLRKYRKVLRAIPYYPSFIKKQDLRIKAGLENLVKLDAAITVLDNAGILVIVDSGYVSRLKEDLSNVD